MGLRGCERLSLFACWAALVAPGAALAAEASATAGGAGQRETALVRPEQGAAPSNTAARAGQPAQAAAKDEDEKKDTDCAFGLIVWCLVESERYRGGAPSSFRLEAFGGYKPSNLYYKDEIRACDEAGCELDFKGPAFGLDAYYNITGDPRSDDYTALGIAASYIPIVTEIRNNTAGFQGELGPVRAGDGTLAYVPIRLSLRRSHFLYLIKSKYMVSSFGVGLAIPVSSGAGETFTGADSVKITIGGKLGAEIPVADPLKIGIATNWSVIWYGGSFTEASFTSAYGLNLTYLL